MDAERAADAIFGWRTRRSPMRRLPDEIRPASEDEGYALQELLHDRLTAHGWGPILGLKIGCTTPVMQDYLSIPQPCMGGVFETAVRRGSGEACAADHLRLGVECEIAVTLAGDLPPRESTYTRDTVTPAVGDCMAAMELVDDRYADYLDFGIASLIADDFFNAGCVLGEPVRNWRHLDLVALTGVMSINGEEIGRGVGADIMGHPLEALAWLANRRARLGQGLRAGTFVLLGSVVQTQWLKAGDTVRIAVEGLGEATLRVT